jgi:hypothetical protein
LQKILIDENLSPSLEAMAHERGFQCSHVNHLGKTGQKDWELKQAIIEGDWTFVTNNSIDFRGPADKPGSVGEYADVRLHAGLVCINAPGGLTLVLQRQLFGFILDELSENGDLINQVLEVDLHRNGEVELRRRALPKENSGSASSRAKR